MKLMETLNQCINAGHEMMATAARAVSKALRQRLRQLKACTGQMVVAWISGTGSLAKSRVLK